MNATRPKRRVLISVSDKRGIEQFARRLCDHGIDIVSTGNTAKILAAAEIPVTTVEAVTGSPEMLRGRVKTLHPAIHGPLIAAKSDIPELSERGMEKFFAAVIDLYPMEPTIEEYDQAVVDGRVSPQEAFEAVIEQTDIGGPAMLRSGAKSDCTIVIATQEDRDRFLAWLDAGEPDYETFRRELSAKAEGIVAGYCLASACYRSAGVIDGMIGTVVAKTSYGENAHQQPAHLLTTRAAAEDPLALSKFALVAGNPPSYNNYLDLSRLIATMTQAAAGFQKNLGYVPKMAIAAKHGNPCGAAFHDVEPIAVCQNTVMGDPLAIHGGLLITNFNIYPADAEALIHHGMEGDKKRLFDAIIAPGFTMGAIERLQRKTGKCRLLENEALKHLTLDLRYKGMLFRQARGEMLRQPAPRFVPNFLDGTDLTFIGEIPDLTVMADLLFAWAIGSTSNSNTITLVRNGMLIGNGVGRQDRVGAAELAISIAVRGHHALAYSSAYSDSFFPFPDGLEALARVGVKHVLTSSGSVNDPDVIAAAQAWNMTLVLVPDAVGRGFYAHG